MEGARREGRGGGERAGVAILEGEEGAYGEREGRGRGEGRGKVQSVVMLEGRG